MSFDQFDQTVSYTYYRSKSIIDDDEGLGKVFLGFVALSIMKEQALGDTKRQKLTAGPGFYKETPIEETPSQLVKLPNKDTEIFLTKAEYELLEKLAEEDELAFWLYKTSIA